jgi:hypothetical protein
MRVLLLCSVFAIGCGGEGKQTCVPGATVSCACSDGSQGAQECLADGTFAGCVCQLVVGDGPDMARRDDSSNPVNVPDMATSQTVVGEKRLFVTSTQYAATALATVCQDSADAASLGGTWKPWLSTSTVDAIDIIQGSGPWKLLDGTVAFKNHAQLATQPSAPINITEQNNTLNASQNVWTGTGNGGRDSSYDCFSWTSTGDNGTVGSSDSTSTWTFASYSGCNYQNHVYCFEQ